MAGGINISTIEQVSPNGLHSVISATADTAGATTTYDLVGSGTMTGTSLTVTDAFITSSTYVSIFPLGTKAGTWTVNSTAGSFTITSTKTETSCAFKWSAIK